MRIVGSSCAIAFVVVTVAGCGAKVQDGTAQVTDSDPPDAYNTVPDASNPPPPPPPPDTFDGGPPPPPPPPTGAAQPPPRPSTASGPGATRWFALRKLQVGLTDRATGKRDAKAWMEYGYDLDSRTTTKELSPTSTNSCKRRSGSPTRVLADGHEGRDNNFGQHMMAVVQSLKADSEEAANRVITDGVTTLLLRLDNVGADDNGSVPGALYLATTHGSLPTFTVADRWPIATTSLMDGKTISASKYAFPKGYMSKGIWVSGDFGTGSFTVPLPIFGLPMNLPLQSGIISFRVADGGAGTIAGAIDTDALKYAITPSMKSFGICPGNATYDQVVETLTQSADLVSGAPYLQDTSKECNALSIGLGFVAAPTGVPTTVAPPPPPPIDECGPGFFDGGT